jgi:hypothetical protein
MEATLSASFSRPFCRLCLRFPQTNALSVSIRAHCRCAYTCSWQPSRGASQEVLLQTLEALKCLVPSLHPLTVIPGRYTERHSFVLYSQTNTPPPWVKRPGKRSLGETGERLGGFSIFKCLSKRARERPSPCTDGRPYVCIRVCRCMY